MYLPFLSSLHEFPLSVTKNLFTTMMELQPYISDSQKDSGNIKKEYKSIKANPVSVACKCCGWKGKDSETRSEVFYLEQVTELELFCPQCNSYIGFL